MPTASSILASETDPRVADLRSRLDAFYARADQYVDFHHQNFKDQYWTPIRDRIRQIINAKGSCRVLEFGAGCTGFPNFLADLRSSVHFTAQDITPANRAHLAAVADHVHLADLKSLQGPFDIIFSTFVWEHVTDPNATLAHLLSLLASDSPVGSSLFIACPRYDFPGYVPPSARHYSKLQQYRLSCNVALNRLSTILTRKPKFLLHLDPSMFHRPWYPDADAVHWPSAADLRASLPQGFSLSHVHFSHRNFKQWVFARLLLLFVRIDRTPAHAPHPARS